MLEILTVAVIGTGVLLALQIARLDKSVFGLQRQIDDLVHENDILRRDMDEATKAVMLSGELFKILDERTEGVDFIRDYLVEQLAPDDAYIARKPNIVELKIVKDDD